MLGERPGWEITIRQRQSNEKKRAQINAMRVLSRLDDEGKDTRSGR